MLADTSLMGASALPPRLETSMTLRAPIVLALALAVALAGCASVPSSHGVPSGNVAVDVTKAGRLAGLYEEFWEETLRRDPTQATVLGDPRYNGVLPDYFSAAYRQEEH